MKWISYKTWPMQILDNNLFETILEVCNLSILKMILKVKGWALNTQFNFLLI